MGIRIASGDGQLPAEVRQKNEIALTFKNQSRAIREYLKCLKHLKAIPLQAANEAFSLLLIG